MSDERYDDRNENDRSRHSRHSGGFSNSDHGARAGMFGARRVSWGAIFAGTAITLAIWIVLVLLGSGIGLGLVQPTSGGSATNATVGIGGAIWWVLCGIISLVMGGYVAARLAGVTRAIDGVLQGVTTWAVTTLVMIYMLTNAIGGIVGGAANVAGGIASTASQSMSSAIPQAAQASGISPDQMQSKVGDLLDNQSSPPPQQMNRDQAITAITELVPKLAGDGQQSQQARQRIIAIVSAQSGISQQQASQRLDQWQQQATSTVDDAKQTATQAANSATDIAASVAFWSSIMLIVGLCSAAIGGALGKQRDRARAV